MLGDDFEWVRGITKFMNIDRVIKDINTKMKGKYFLKYSTPSEYTSAVNKIKEKFSIQKNKEYDRDFFPLMEETKPNYESKLSFWTAFYSNRPIF